MNTSNELRTTIRHDMRRVALILNNLHAEVCKLISDMDRIENDNILDGNNNGVNIVGDE